MPRVCLTIPCVLLLAGVCTAQVTITEYPLPAGGNGPFEIMKGPDGNLWFTESGASRLGRITYGGAITQFPFASGSGRGITTGPDGNIWFIKVHCCFGPNSLMQVTPSGVMTEFPAPWGGAFGASGDAGYITSGPSGHLWATGLYSVHEIQPNGTNFPFWPGEWLVPLDGPFDHPGHIITGPDGNVWVSGRQSMSKLTPAGVLTKYQLGLSFPGYLSGADWLTSGPDGKIWFTGGTHPLSGQPAIGKLTTSGSVTYLSIGLVNASGTGITTGPDGNIWFVGGSLGGDSILRMRPDALCDSAAQCNAAIQATPLPSQNPNALPGSIVTGCDGNLWFTMPYANKIGKAVIAGPRIADCFGNGNGNISSTNPDGAYLTGASITVTITFDSVVTVTGTPQLALNSGGVAAYSSGSGTNTLSFVYTVAAGQIATRLDAASNTALTLNGGSIRDALGRDAILTLPVYPAAHALGANKLLVINPADPTPPVSTASGSPGANTNGWNRTDVTVTINATDTGTGVKQIQYSVNGGAAQIVTGSTASVLITSEGVNTVSYFATDNAGNVEAAKTFTVNLDKTAPTVTFGAASPAANAAGWNNSNVSIAFTAADALSGVDSAPASPLLLTAEGMAVTGSVTVTDRAGNSATFNSPAVKIDKTAPLISGSRAPLPNANNWNNTNVTVSFPCTDALSGVAPGSPTPDVVLSTEGMGLSASGSCVDAAGNSASVTVSDINIDKTAPTATAAAAPAANAFGWNNSNVTVTFAGADALSGIDTCATAMVLSAEGSGQSASGTCTDKAGNVSVPAVQSGINIDKTGPVVTFGAATPAANSFGWNNTNVSIPYTVADSLSGLAPSTPGAGSVDLSSEGSAVTGAITVSDKAGNTATISSPMVKIDKTGPVLTGSRAPAPNAGGWNNSDVTVTFACADGLSGVASVIPAAPVVLSADGANQSASASCQDRAGNPASASVAPINIDKTKPAVSNVVTNPAPVPDNTPFTLSATVSESGSGAPAVQYNVDGGSYSPLTLVNGPSGLWSAAIPALGAGAHTVCVLAGDAAGNQNTPVCLLLGANSNFWIGLQNSDDQGTQFDVRTELYKNGTTLIASGETRCITGVTRNPDLAKAILVPFDSMGNAALAAGDVVTLKVLTRIGTNPDGTKCAGPGGSHSNAVGLRLYYDAASRPSRMAIGLGSAPIQDYFLHSIGSNLFLDTVTPTAASPQNANSTSLNFAGGNLWKQVGAWNRTVQ